MLLGGMTVVITGAASARGIGLATARLMAENGARIAILDLDHAKATEAAASLPTDGVDGAHLALACDVTDAAQCREAAQLTVETFGRIDGVVANAGVTQPVKIMEITAEDWQRIIDTNLTGVLNTCQAFIPALRAQRSGSIACMSSVSAQRGGGIFGGPHYSAAKAGVLGLAKAMARELGPDNVRVNCVTPGLIETDITGGMLTDEMRGEILKGIPLARLGGARDVAGAYLFLISPLSGYITGAVIDVNGGMLIHG